MSEQQHSGLNRRGFIGALGTGATMLAATPFFSGEAHAQGQPSVAATASTRSARTRTIPRTQQTLTTLGLGTFLTFDAKPGDDRRNLGEVFRRYVAGGGRVVDTSPLYGSAEVSVGAFLAGTPEASEIFVANKIWSTGEYLGDESHAVASFEQSRLRIWRDTIDLMQCHSIVNAPVVIPLMQAWKKEGRIRYVGVTHHEAAAQDQLAELVERGGVDFIQTNYSIFDRSAERRLLPAAEARGVGVLINLPLEKARLMKVVEGRSLPDFAREFEAATWAQFFLKWVMAHRAVTTVLCGTSNPEHAEDNVQAMYGPLPDETMRRRMVQHMETIPGFADIGRMPWYPGKEAQYQGLIRAAQATARTRLGQ
ncbi:aldo/keto reductase [Phyllobacterium salinisoli]|uniref:Aldo/keto reductase n=1 Tax=Phyllobacterium salinisoli TaxID=1899321 RepID=A0A368K335_9HYPH|nr:aldo/keto reductase [Phyllobacterium salinisoli]RCS23799.1 aldo/keto reductase [Phyllobacterium salinisoli]